MKPLPVTIITVLLLVVLGRGVKSDGDSDTNSTTAPPIPPSSGPPPGPPLAPLQCYSGMEKSDWNKTNCTSTYKDFEDGDKEKTCVTELGCYSWVNTVTKEQDRRCHCGTPFPCQTTALPTGTITTCRCNTTLCNGEVKRGVGKGGGADAIGAPKMVVTLVVAVMGWILGYCYEALILS